MRCPFCGAIDTRVVDSRLVGDSDQVRRRRECTDCEERFTTYESAELNLPRVVKSRGDREPFSEAKLQAGFQKALQKRPVSVGDVDRAVARVRHRVLVAGEREIDAQRIGEWVMDELQQLDEVAYIRFASVYRRFEDAAAFREALDTLAREPDAVDAANQLSLLDDPVERPTRAAGLPVVRSRTKTAANGQAKAEGTARGKVPGKARKKAREQARGTTRTKAAPARGGARKR